MLISVVIPTYNDPIRLEWVLAGLAHQTFTDFETIVVNDGGESYGPAISLPSGFRAQVLDAPHSDEQFRVGQARNFGAQHATGDLLLFLDQDCVPPPRILEAHADYYRRYGAAFVGAGRRYNVPEAAVGPLSPTADFDAELGRLQAIARTDGHEDVDETFRVLIWGCHLSMDRRVFLDMGGFDNRFVGWGGEDGDLLTRILDLGLHTVNMGLRNAVLHLNHPLRESPLSAGNNQLVHELRGTGIVRNGGPLPSLATGALPNIDDLIEDNKASTRLTADDYAIRVGEVA